MQVYCHNLYNFHNSGFRTGSGGGNRRGDTEGTLLCWGTHRREPGRDNATRGRVTGCGTHTSQTSCAHRDPKDTSSTYCRVSGTVHFWVQVGEGREVRVGDVCGRGPLPGLRDPGLPTRHLVEHRSYRADVLPMVPLFTVVVVVVVLFVWSQSPPGALNYTRTS